jgi:hypothetical protein
MNLATIAAKQKRVKDWSEALETMVQDSDLREKTRLVLKQYQNLLMRCWDAQLVSDSESAQLQDLERELERLNEVARMTVVPHAFRHTVTHKH